MVETAVFSIFHRVAPDDAAQPAPEDVPADLRARRKAARHAMRQPTPKPAPPEPRREQGFSVPLNYQLLGVANPVADVAMHVTIGRIDEAHPAAAIFDHGAGLAAGTRILTAKGEVAVEALAPGDAVLGLRSGALLPIAWIGRSLAAEPPVHIAAGAFGPDRPRAGLCVAADHMIILEGAPVAARALINGRTVQTLEHANAELYQIAVNAAETLLAEGVPVASAQR